MSKWEGFQEIPSGWIELGLSQCEFALKEGILERPDTQKLYTGSSGGLESIIPILCACDPKDNLRNFLRQQRRLGLVDSLRDMSIIQLAGGPIWGSGAPGKSEDLHSATASEDFYVQIQLMHGATHVTRFPFILHFPCKVCYLYRLSLFCQFAQLLDATAKYKKRYTGMPLTTVPLFDMDGGDKSKPSTITYFVNRSALVAFINTIKGAPDSIRSYFRNKEEFFCAQNCLS